MGQHEDEEENVEPRFIVACSTAVTLELRNSRMYRGVDVAGRRWEKLKFGELGSGGKLTW